MQFFTVQNSMKRGIDESATQKAPKFVLTPPPGLDELQVIRLCQETFAEEYAKRMVQYHADIKHEIDEVQRAKELLKDERASHQRDILETL